MNWQVITGIVFAGVLVIFFMAAYFFPPRGSSNADKILRLLASVLAGAAGAFLSGGISLEIDGNLSTLANVAISATGGVALFTLVWTTWNQTMSEGFSVTIPTGSTFKEAAKTIGVATGKSVQLSGFSESELNLKSPTAVVISAQPSVKKALEVLRNYYPENLPEYVVLSNETGYELQKSIE